MSGSSVIYSKFPDEIRINLNALPNEIQMNFEEIRIQIGQPVCVRCGKRELIIGDKITRKTMDIILSNFLDHSIYAYEEELVKGYVTIEGGHRIGVCGTVVKDNDSVKFLKDISSVNIRRSREIKGCGEPVLREIMTETNGLHNTIIVSPPKCGKTTLLRDIVRILSNRGYRIGVCDERSEIAGMFHGQPTYDLGPRTDVLDRCNKAEGMLMLIRSMAPEVIITDEIGQNEDIRAIQYALTAGVKVITTIHGENYNDLINSQIGDLIKDNIFKRIIILSNLPNIGTIKEVMHV